MGEETRDVGETSVLGEERQRSREEWRKRVASYRAIMI